MQVEGHSKLFYHCSKLWLRKLKITLSKHPQIKIYKAQGQSAINQLKPSAELFRMET